jgi:4-hydroxy-tetrahydrodipicolinate synthase
MSHQFAGTGVALVTPFTKDGAVDYPALEKLVNSVITGGVSYLVALGTTAETPTLSVAEKQDILTFIIAKCNNRVPVVCGVGGNNTAEIVQQLKAGLPTGVAGILSVSPYYSKPTQEGIYQHFKAIAAATNLPIILYNVPGRTSSNMLPATVLRLANEVANIVAIKEASGNLAQCMELVQHKPARFAILSGDDNLALAQIAVGMDGIISVAANCFTPQFCRMVQLALDGKFAEARRLHYKLLTGIDLLFADGNPAGAKCAMHLMGMCANVLRLPLVPARQETESLMSEFVDSLKAAVAG